MSFTRAAEQRLLTQPAVSRQVRQLEQQLGVPLFEKLGKSVHLTDAGRALVPQAAELLGRMERIAESVRSFRGADRGRLRIGASTTPGYYVLPAILGEFHRENPGVELGYVVENTLTIEQRLIRNELDIGFVGARPTHGVLRSQPVMEDEIVCFCGPRHTLAGRHEIKSGDLQGELWVVRERGSATRQLFEQRFRRLGGKISRILELTSPEGIKALVGAGIGLAYLSAHGLGHEILDGRLHRVRISGLRLTRPIHVVRHADKHESPPMKALMELLTRLTKQPA
ncbi:MAG: LysR family transcriptional regulator [Planctomycetes bacterium]|nr:LysR family transcriptional regulator [Planctomycetota bacterium]